MGIKLSTESKCQDMVQQLLSIGVTEHKGKRVQEMNQNELTHLLNLRNSKQVNIESESNKWF